jgi:hypothetical protein
VYTPGVSRAQDAGAGSNPEGCDQPLARKVLLSWTRFRVRLPGHAKLLFAHATWIEAEIPQDLHRQIRGIGAVERDRAFHTPVFCGASPQKMRAEFLTG